LIDAEQFWNAEDPGQLKSGPWSETDPAGREYALEASAMCLGPHQMLCITFPKIEFAEQQSLVQKAREERLEYIQLHKEIQKKIFYSTVLSTIWGPLAAIIGSLSLLEEEELTPYGKGISGHQYAPGQPTATLDPANSRCLCHGDGCHRVVCT